MLVLLAGVAVVVLSIAWLRLHAFFALVLGAFTIALLTQPANAGPAVAAGFATMCGKVGIVIAMAAVIGKCLLDSGGAERIVLAIRNLFGDRRVSPAFATSSFVLGIPVFFDTVFYLLMPLGRAMARQTGSHYLLYTLSIVAGATMAHSLVPPTPGPLAVAEALDVPLLHMIAGGLVLGAITVSSGLAYARWIDCKLDLPLRPTEMDQAQEPVTEAASLPSLWFSLLPILLPLPLLAANNVIDALYGESGPRPPAARVWETLGDKNVALTLAALVALVLLARRKTGKELPAAMQSALMSGGVIILITAAGGAFGMLIRDSAGLIESLKSISPEGQLLLLPIAFAVTAFVRAAQGSATVAMMTGVFIVAGLAETLVYNPLYLALAIGCGSKPFPWMNDSGFWIISRMSGMTVGETLRTVTAMLTLMGFTGLPVVMLGAWLLPLS